MSILSAKELSDAVAEGRGMAVRACGTCRHYHRGMDIYFAKCSAVSGYADIARWSRSACGPNGLLWEAKPLRHPGIIARIWRFFFGYQP